MSQAQVHMFRRTASYSMPLNQQLGFLSSGFAASMVFSLSTLSFYVNGVGAATAAVPSISEFTTLFDQYQIRGIDIEIYWSKNIAGETNPAYSAPLLWSTPDYDDVGNTQIQNIMQYPAVRTTHLGEGGGKVFHQYIRPACRLEMPDGLGGTAFSPQLGGPQWIDCNYAAVEHYGMKFVLDTFGRSTNYDMGSLLFVVRHDFAFKNVR